MEAIITQFIPIIIIFLLLSYPKNIIKLSHSILGRLIAVSIIIYYSSLDKYLGLLVCGLVIFYYQMDYVEGFENDEYEGFENDEYEGFEEGLESETAKDTISTLLDNSYKQFTYYTDLYNNEIPKPIIATEPEENFRNEYCDKNGNVIYKDSIINLEMLKHLFPEINFNNDKCNPCDKNCRFSMIESKINNNEKLKPISTTAFLNMKLF